MIFNVSFTHRKKQISRIVIPVTILFFTIFIGVVSYLYIGRHFGISFSDALYMTFITVTTVGYEEIVPLNNFGRIITVFIAIVGIGSLFYLMTAIMENLVSTEMILYRRNLLMEKKIANFNEHIIVIGMGRVGTTVLDQLEAMKKTSVVIDQVFENEEAIASSDVFCIKGDATEDIVLEKAGIRKAAGLIITTSDPAVSTFVIIMAKELNPDIYIIARLDEDKHLSKLKTAGADRIVNPYKTAGYRLTNMMINHDVVDVIETNFGKNMPQMSLETIDVSNNSTIVGKSLGELNLRKDTGVTVLVIMHGDQAITNPSAQYTFSACDRVTMFGTHENLRKVEKLISG